MGKLVKDPEEAKLNALQQYPDCTFADWENGMDGLLRMTIVVNLWRNEETYLAGDPPRHTVQGYIRQGHYNV